MVAVLLTILHSRIFHGAIAGMLAAASVDYQSFKSWKTFHDVAVYQWDTALFRWLHGAFIGAVSAGVVGGGFPAGSNFSN